MRTGTSEAVRLIGAGVVYFLLGRLGLTLSVVEGNVTLAWPPSGWALAVLFVGGWRYVPPLALAAFATTLSTSAPWLFAVFTGVGNTAFAVVGAWLLARTGFTGRMDRPASVVLLCAVAVASTVLSAAIGSTGLYAAGMVPAAALGGVAWKWWVGDAMGVLLVTPAVLTFRSFAMGDGHRRWKAAGALLVLVVVSALVHLHLYRSRGAHPGFGFFPFPVLLWIALRHGPPATALANLLFGAIAVAGVALGRGPLLVAGELHARLAETWSYFAVMLLSSLFLAAVVAQRRQAHLALAASIAEREEIERQAAEAQRLESVGRLAGGVAHDLNNYLTVVRVHGDLVGQVPGAARHSEAILEGVEGARRLVQQLLGLARRERSEPEETSLDAVVAQHRTLVESMAGRHVTASFDLGAGELPILVDRQQVGRVLINLVTNACDAMPEGGHLDIRTSRREVTEPLTSAHGAVPEGSYVSLTVRDSGVGIPESLIPQIFEPFFTTKEVGRGTGLGLAASHGLVAQNAGFLLVESEPDVGSSFTVLFPTSVAAEPTPPRPTEADPSEGRGRILVVEDQASLRSVIVQALGGEGFEIHCASDAEAAMDALRREDGAVDLVLTDIVMPGRSGIDLARDIEATYPGVPILFMTGYVEHAEELEGRSVLAKPFTVGELVKAVQGALGAATKHPR